MEAAHLRDELNDLHQEKAVQMVDLRYEGEKPVEAVDC